MGRPSYGGARLGRLLFRPGAPRDLGQQLFPFRAIEIDLGQPFGMGCVGLGPPERAQPVCSRYGWRDRPNALAALSPREPLNGGPCLLCCFRCGGLCAGSIGRGFAATPFSPVIWSACTSLIVAQKPASARALASWAVW